MIRAEQEVELEMGYVFRTKSNTVIKPQTPSKLTAETP
jgi:hypothetical protein